MGGSWAAGSRGVADRGIGHRITTQTPRAPQSYPSFDPLAASIIGQTGIPNALAWGLKWQLEFLALPDKALGEKQKLADKLIQTREYLQQMEMKVPRRADGVLLIDDPLAQSSGALKGGVRYVEVAYERSIPVVGEREVVLKAVWAPTVFPGQLDATEREQYPALPRSLEEIPPFSQDCLREWQRASAWRPEPEGARVPAAAVPSARGPTKDPYTTQLLNDDDPPGKPTSEDALEGALNAAMKAGNRLTLAGKQAAATRGPLPNVAKVIGTLAGVSLLDIEHGAGVKLPSGDSERPLLERTVLILYHSVFSFVLDRKGEPFDLRDTPDGKHALDYGIVVGEPGDGMKRTAPPPPGVYVGLQTQGFGNFRIEQGEIKKLESGGVGGFHVSGYGRTGLHEYHKRIQEFLNRKGGYIAAITVPAALKRREITLDLLVERLPEYVEVVTPLAVAEIGARASKMLENWEEYVKQATEAAIRGVIIEKVKDRIRSFLIKKIGAKIIPLVNALSTMHEVLSGGDERMRVRHAIACVLVALRSESYEDMTLAAKVTGKIMADEFEDKVIAELIKAAKVAKVVLRRRVARGGGGHEGTQRSPSDQKKTDGSHKAADEVKELAKASERGAHDTDKPAGSANEPLGDLSALPEAGKVDAGVRKAQALHADPYDPLTPQQRAAAQSRILEDTRRLAIEAVEHSTVPPPEKAKTDHKGTKDRTADEEVRAAKDKKADDKGTSASGAGVRPAAEGPPTTSEGGHGPLRNTGAQVDDADAALAARGLPDTAAIHPEQSGKGNVGPLDKHLGSGAGDPMVDDTESGKGGPKKASKEGQDPKNPKTEKPRSMKEDQDEEDRELVSKKAKGKPQGKPKDILLLPIDVHTTPRSFRKHLADYFREDPNHPLIALFDRKKDRLNPSTKPGMDEFYWHEHPEAMQAGHVISKHTGAPDTIVIMTASENQKYKATIEGRAAGASIQGNFQVAIIKGLPISVESAKHLISFGKLKPEDLRDAFKVNVSDL